MKLKKKHVVDNRSQRRPRQRNLRPAWTEIEGRVTGMRYVCSTPPRTPPAASGRRLGKEIGMIELTTSQPSPSPHFLTFNNKLFLPVPVVLGPDEEERKLPVPSAHLRARKRDALPPSVVWERCYLILHAFTTMMGGRMTEAASPGTSQQQCVSSYGQGNDEHVSELRTKSLTMRQG